MKIMTMAVLFGDENEDNDRDSDFMPDEEDDQEPDKFEVVLTQDRTARNKVHHV